MSAASIDSYILTVDGLDGGVTAAGTVGAFQVADFKMDLSAFTDTSGPAPLVIDLLPGAHLNGFIQHITQKRSFQHVRLQGLSQNENGLFEAAYDLRLEGVYVTKVTDTDGVDRLEFVYKAVSLTTRDLLSADGHLGPP